MYHGEKLDSGWGQEGKTGQQSSREGWLYEGTQACFNALRSLWKFLIFSLHLCSVGEVQRDNFACTQAEDVIRRKEKRDILVPLMAPFSRLLKKRRTFSFCNGPHELCGWFCV